MTSAEFEQLRMDVRAYGDACGVVAMLRMVNTQQSAATSDAHRLMLRVFRFVAGESPTESSPAHGYRPDARDLTERLRADIRAAAEKLGQSEADAQPALRTGEQSK